MKTKPNSDGGMPKDVIDSFAQDMLRRMSPLQGGKLLYALRLVTLPPKKLFQVQ